MLVKNCEYCGKPLVQGIREKPCQFAARRFCGHFCAAKSYHKRFPRLKPEARYCEYCGKILIQNPKEKPVQLAKRRFCDRTCSKMLKEPSYGAQGYRVKKFRKEICAICGKKSVRHDVHHIDGNRLNDFPENVQTLCHSCHLKVHWSIRKQSRLMENAC